MTAHNTKLVSEHALRRHSRRVAGACSAIAVLLPVLLILAWVGAGPAALVENGFGAHATVSPGPLQSALALVVALAPVLILSFALLAARRCFLAYAAGAWFTERAAGALRTFGARIVAAAALGFVTPTVITLILTVNAAPGERILAISISSGPILGCLLGVMIWLFADVQRRAAELAADHATIV